MSGTRSFVAVELSAEVRRRLREVRRTLVRLAPAWEHEKWVAEDNLHTTLKFLGDMDELQLIEVRFLLADALMDTAAFSLGLAGLRAVPGRHRCSMVWARFEDPDSLCAELAERVERAAVASGAAAEERPFTPHATIVRARRPRRLHAEALDSANALALEPRISMSVRSVTLFASALTQTGPVYEAIDSWTLGTAGK